MLRLKGDVNSGTRRIPETKRSIPETMPIGRYKSESNIRVKKCCGLWRCEFSNIRRCKNDKHKLHNLAGQNSPAVPEASVDPEVVGRRPGHHPVRSQAGRLHAMLELVSAAQPIGVVK